MSFNKSLLLLFVGFLLVLCFLKSDAAEDKNLVLYLSFDEGNGNAVKDLSGSRNDGVINGKIKPLLIYSKGSAISSEKEKKIAN